MLKSRFVRYALIGAGALLGLVLVSALALWLFFPKDLVRRTIEEQVELATERDLTLGDIDVAVFPALGLSASDVTLSNPAGFEGEPFLQAERVVFAVALFPLMRGDIEVRRLIIEEPALALAVNEAGLGNWTFPKKDDPERLEALRIDEFRVAGGALSYAGASGEPLSLSDIDASVRLPGLDEEAAFDARFTYAERRVAVAGDLGLPRALLEEGQTPLEARIEAPRIEASFDGAFDAATGALQGRLEAEGESLRDTLAWFGVDLPAGDAYAAYSIAAALAARGSTETAPTTIALQDGTYALDALRATGGVALTFSESGRMRVSGALTIPEMDVNPYLPPPPANAQAGVNMQTAWPTTPLDLSGLNALDADLTLAVPALRFQRMRFADARLSLAVNNGAADARLTQVSLYGGAGTARLTANAAGNRITSTIDVQNIQAEPLLTDAIGFTRVSGRGRLRASVSGAGASQAALMRSLAGDASFTFNDGALKGVNLALVARTIQSALSGQARGEAAATDFAELAATFQINNGVAATQDLRMLNPYVRMDGQGLIDIGGQSIDMRLSPRAVNTIEGQGGRGDVAGVGVPFRVRGPWMRPSYSIALGDVVRNEIQSRMRDALGGAFGRSGQAAPEGEAAPAAEQQRQNPVEQLGDLFRRRN